MNRVTAKICGLSTADTLGAAVKHGASHVGFVFFPASPRHVTFGQAASLTALVPAHIARVGVFVDPEDGLIDEAILIGGVDLGNVERAAGMTGARLIDISSGVETAPGIKDVDKIAAFLQRVAAL